MTRPEKTEETALTALPIMFPTPVVRKLMICSSFDAQSTLRREARRSSGTASMVPSQLARELAAVGIWRSSRLTQESSSGSTRLRISIRPAASVMKAASMHTGRLLFLTAGLTEWVK